MTDIGEENSVFSLQYPKSPQSVPSFIRIETRREFA